MSDLTGTITSSHDPAPPALPPLPEAILFTLNAGDTYWSATWGTTSLMDKLQMNMNAREGVSTRLVTLTPPSAREASDAEVAAIVRRGVIEAGGIACGDDNELMSHWTVAAACVRAALTKGRGA